MTRTPARRSLTTPLWPLTVCAVGFLVPLNAADKPEAATATTSPSEMEQLKRMLLDKQRQIDELRRLLADKKTPEPAAAVTNPVAAHPSTGEVASTRPVVPSAPSPIPAAF